MRLAEMHMKWSIILTDNVGPDEWRDKLCNVRKRVWKFHFDTHGYGIKLIQENINSLYFLDCLR